MKGLSRQTTELQPLSSFRLCIELSVPQNLSTNSPRILSIPAVFFGSRNLPRFVGLTERGQDWCLNWQLELNNNNNSNNDEDNNNNNNNNSTLSIPPKSTSLKFGQVERDFSQGLYIGTVQVSVEESFESISITEDTKVSNYVPFLSGRTEIISGVIHILRELPTTTTSSSSNDQRVQLGEEEGGLKDCRKAAITERIQVYRQKMLSSNSKEASSLGVIYQFLDSSVVLILAIPAVMTPSELLRFIGDEHLEKIEQLRLLRDAAPNRYMAIIKFCQGKAARNFMFARDGQNFFPLEPEICHVVSVNSVEFSTRASVLEPLFEENEFIETRVEGALGLFSSMERGGGGGNFMEIPACPICLERIDSEASGILIPVCSHKVHCRCLSRWGDGRCPVCRFALEHGKTGKDLMVCSSCDCVENIWTCLICGHLGCSRYDSGHANDHYCATGHNFSLELDTHHVWDYSGDNYVHRIIQSKEDGKLLEIPPPTSGLPISTSDAPLKTTIEPDYYASLLVAQLESQRMFFESRLDAAECSSIDRIEQLTKDHAREIRRLSNDLKNTKQELRTLDEAYQERRVAFEAKIQRLCEEKAMLSRDLEGERAISRQALSTTDTFLELIRDKDVQIQALDEQVRDLIVHLESQQRLSSSPSLAELAGGSVSIPNSSSPLPKRPHRRKGR